MLRFLIACVLAVLLFFVVAFLDHNLAAACSTTQITPNTPTGIAGCYRWGEGTASHYGPGDGVAMNFCTWERRHAQGCGSVQITSLETGSVTIAPVIDFCDCYTGTPRERIIDLQHGVVEALGLPLGQGLYPVRVEPVTKLLLPDTAISR